MLTALADPCTRQVPRNFVLFCNALFRLEIKLAVNMATQYSYASYNGDVRQKMKMFDIMWMQFFYMGLKLDL
jgi:hypothetical protein